ncbi:MAG: 6-bladed beta-propeller [Thermomicrobiales bacterium]
MTQMGIENTSVFRRRGGRPFAVAGALLAGMILVFSIIHQVMAAAPANSYFQSTWQRTDDPVSSGLVSRTWMWGPEGFTGEMTEAYAESPNGERTVQYFDKSRMEITDPSATSSSVWYVTNGLLVVELISGRMQIGDAQFVQRGPAAVNVAGDADDPSGVQYSTLAGLLDAPALADGEAITQRLDRTGNVTSDPTLAGFGVTAAYRVTEPGIDHQVASPFWEFMNSSGTVYENGAYINAPMFLSPFYATGYPITEAYWAEVKVGGTYRNVLLQCFERRCLTYTPDNPDGWQVEAGNVGQHYYAWRYGQTAGEDPTEAGTEPPTVIPSPTTTAPPGATTQPTATLEPSPTATRPGDPTAEPTPPPTQEPYLFAGQWSGPVNEEAAIDSAYAIAVDGEGYVYVSDWQAGHILKYAPNGRLVTMWGTFGTGEGEFSNPMGIAVDADGNVYISDYNNNRVQKFSADGEYLDEWGTLDGARGSGPGDFDGPRGIAVDRSGSVYVVDSNNYRVQKFDRDGTYLDEWGSDGSGNGQFTTPTGIVIDDDDTIYVSDYLRCRVQLFDTGGNYIDEIDTDTTGGTCSFQFDVGLAVDADGTIYVVDSGKDRVQAFDRAGNLLGAFGTNGSGPAEFSQPIGIAIDDRGRLYVTDFDNARVQVFDRNRNYLDEWVDARRGWIAESTLAMTMDAGGNIFLADNVYDRIQVFDSSGAYIREFGEPGSGTGQLDGVIDIAASLDGYIYAVDPLHDRVLKFQRNGSYVTEWTGSLDQPVAVAVDPDGNVYVANAGDDTIRKFDNSGAPLISWGGSGDGEGEFNGPVDIAIRGNLVLIVDQDNNRVQVFDRDGVYLSRIGQAGDGNGEFAEPMGVAIDSDGSVFVVDSGNHRVQKFSSSGEYLTQFGSSGSGDGFLSYPTRIEVDQHRTVFVLDTGNQRIELFSRLSDRL